MCAPLTLDLCAQHHRSLGYRENTQTICPGANRLIPHATALTASASPCSCALCGRDIDQCTTPLHTLNGSCILSHLPADCLYDHCCIIPSPLIAMASLFSFLSWHYILVLPVSSLHSLVCVSSPATHRWKSGSRLPAPPLRPGAQLSPLPAQLQRPRHSTIGWWTPIGSPHPSRRTSPTSCAPCARVCPSDPCRRRASTISAAQTGALRGGIAAAARSAPNAGNQ